MTGVLVEESMVGVIPILTMRETTRSKRPLVIYLHGFTSEKRQGIEYGYELARRGFYFVAMDALMHGDRTGPRLDDVLAVNENHTYPVESGLDTFYLMYKIVMQTEADVEFLIDHFSQEPELQPGMIGVTGYSMGGFATFLITARSPSVKASVPIAGVPAFETRWRDVVLESSTHPEWKVRMAIANDETERISTLLREIDPYGELAGFAPKPLMMIHGDQDTDCPKYYSVRLYRDLFPHYKDNPEALQLRIYDNIAHQLAPIMVKDAADWFESTLLND